MLSGIQGLQKSECRQHSPLKAQQSGHQKLCKLGRRVKQYSNDNNSKIIVPSRRQQLAMMLSSASILAQSNISHAAAPVASKYLPEASDGFYLYSANPNKTSALRSGKINSKTPYQFLVPGSWKEAVIPNAMTGNFCMPKCGEPWIEIVFENSAEGKVTLMVTDLKKLTPNPRGTIQDVGTPQSVIPQIGPYITNTQLEEEEVVSAKEVTDSDGRVYYEYESYAPYAIYPPHAVFRFTVKEGNAYLLIAHATDKQWPSNAKQLRAIVSSFQA